MSLALSAFLADPAAAAIYRWTDDQGTVHFSDNLHTVPERYRGQLRTLDDQLPPPAALPRIPLTQDSLGYVVGARVEDAADVRLVVDTGASSTVLAPRVARQLGLQVRRDPPVRVQTANGLVEAGWARVRSLDVGGHRVGPLDVVVHDAIPGADGLLGMNFLRRFRVEIDASGPALILSPHY